MKKRDVEEMDGCKYIEVNDEGLVIERGAGKRSTLEVGGLRSDLTVHINCQRLLLTV
jgi:hypothetical protein